MNKEEVEKLAQLARIEVGDTEAEKLSHEFEAILGYVAEVKGAVDAHPSERAPLPEDFPLRNVLREDKDPHEPGMYTQAILKEAPQVKDGYIVVKKIL